MDEDRTRPPDMDRVDARTTARVDRMTEAERKALARELARRKRAGADIVPPTTPKVEAPASPRAPTAPDPAEAAIIEAELRATERRIDRLERLATRSRYQGGGAEMPGGRYDRLISRANRLERKRRGLR
jgi:hypothetical protein